MAGAADIFAPVFASIPSAVAGVRFGTCGIPSAKFTLGISKGQAGDSGTKGVTSGGKIHAKGFQVPASGWGLSWAVPRRDLLPDYGGTGKSTQRWRKGGRETLPHSARPRRAPPHWRMFSR
jgi:hypothetical protein